MKSFLNKIADRYTYSVILLKELARTDFKLRYQGSILGYVWSLLKPLFMFVILYFVFVKFLKVGGDMPYWPIGLLIGIVVWNFFSEITNASVSAIVGKGDMIRKINFPKYIIVLSAGISALINLLFNMIVIAVFLALNGVSVGWSVLLVPFYVLEVFVFSLGLAFILSALFVRFRDINFIWEILMQGLFYASIVIYPVSVILSGHPKLATLLLLNPVSQAIQDIRHAVVSPSYPTLSSIADGFIVIVPYIIVLTVFAIGAWYFRRRSPYFAEEI